jgi:hypothetical protein
MTNDPGLTAAVLVAEIREAPDLLPRKREEPCVRNKEG